MTSDAAPQIGAILPSLKQADIAPAAARLLEAALELFARKGYAATSVREIVQRAEVTNPVLYYYFESKEGLFYELVAYLLSSQRERVIAAMAAHEGLQEQLVAVAEANFAAALQSPVALRFVLSLIFGPKDSHPETSLMRSHAEAFGRVVQRLERAVAAGQFQPHPGRTVLELAHRFWGMINSQLMQALVLTEAVGADMQQSLLEELLSREAAHALVDFFLSGAGQIGSAEAP